ncbi:hypothetical protein INR49_025902 [Caranx melampygus]|nr:hypothetical protein INR49_025902 [Caranx melampygus]
MWRPVWYGHRCSERSQPRRFNDVAIGAPFENDHRGAVYIYHGDKTSLKEKFVQRIPAGGDGEKVKFFGQSIHGVMDLNGDGITDVTIGGLGGLRCSVPTGRGSTELCENSISQRCCELRANMTFDPSKINLQQSQYQCEHNGRKSVCVTTGVCFVYTIKSVNKDSYSAAEIRYNLTLDALRAKARASFIQSGDINDRRISKTFHIKDGERNMVIKAKKDWIHVNINIRNSKDNAYNTKVILSFSPNINYVKVEPDKECTLNNTKVECAVGYPFLGSNVEPVDEHIVVREGEQYASVINDTRVIGEEVNVSYTVVKAGDVATPPLDLTVTYPHKSPRQNNLLYLTHVSFSPHVKCDAARWINPDGINPKTITPNPIKETLGVFVLTCSAKSDCASFTCTLPEAKVNQVNVTFRVWKPTFIKLGFFKRRSNAYTKDEIMD